MGSCYSRRVSPARADLNGDCPRTGEEGDFVIIDEHARKVTVFNEKIEIEIKSISKFL
jgi:hypothetical protein